MFRLFLGQKTTKINHRWPLICLKITKSDQWLLSIYSCPFYELKDYKFHGQNYPIFYILCYYIGRYCISVFKSIWIIIWGTLKRRKQKNAMYYDNDWMEHPLNVKLVRRYLLFRFSCNAKCKIIDCDFWTKCMYFHI